MLLNLIYMRLRTTFGPLGLFPKLASGLVWHDCAFSSGFRRFTKAGSMYDYLA